MWYLTTAEVAIAGITATILAAWLTRRGEQRIAREGRVSAQAKWDQEREELRSERWVDDRRAMYGDLVAVATEWELYIRRQFSRSDLEDDEGTFGLHYFEKSVGLLTRIQLSASHGVSDRAEELFSALHLANSDISLLALQRKNGLTTVPAAELASAVAKCFERRVEFIEACRRELRIDT